MPRIQFVDAFWSELVFIGIAGGDAEKPLLHLFEIRLQELPPDVQCQKAQPAWLLELDIELGSPIRRRLVLPYLPRLDFADFDILATFLVLRGVATFLIFFLTILPPEVGFESE